MGYAGCTGESLIQTIVSKDAVCTRQTTFDIFSVLFLVLKLKLWWRCETNFLTGGVRKIRRLGLSMDRYDMIFDWSWSHCDGQS